MDLETPVSTSDPIADSSVLVLHKEHQAALPNQALDLGGQAPTWEADLDFPALGQTREAAALPQQAHQDSLGAFRAVPSFTGMFHKASTIQDTLFMVARAIIAKAIYLSAALMG